MTSRMRAFRAFQSQIANRKSTISRAFTLVEMLTTVAVLVIVLGLMVSLARDVRNRSAERVTKDMLAKLDRMMAQYVERNNKALPPITPLVEPAAGEGSPEPTDDAKLKAAALHNNGDLARALRAQADA